MRVNTLGNLLQVLIERGRARIPAWFGGVPERLKGLPC